MDLIGGPEDENLDPYDPEPECPQEREKGFYQLKVKRDELSDEYEGGDGDMNLIDLQHYP